MVKNNKLLKVVLVILAIVSIVSISGVVNAVNPATAAAAGQQTGAGDDGSFVVPTITPSSNDATNKVGDYAGIILSVFQAVGYAVAVIILVWLGIKYILASPDGKAEIKKQAFAYLLGAVLLFAAASIVTLIKSVING